MEITSNKNKLLRHIDNIKKIRSEPRPINVMIDVTTKCNLHCPFCYVSGRPRTHDLNLEEIKHFLGVIKPLSVDISGGEPTLWPHINEFIEWLHKKEIKIGLITNGVLLNRIDIKNLNKLSWLRISINEYLDKEFPPTLVIPDGLNMNVFLGGQYIYHPGSPPYFILLEKLEEFQEKYPRFLYIRVSEDVTSTVEIFDEELNWEYPVFKRIIPRLYEGECFMGWIKPLVEANGKVYACAGNIDVKVGDKIENDCSFIGTIKEPEKLLNYKPKIVQCKYCKSYDKNQFIKTILAPKVLHEEFI